MLMQKLTKVGSPNFQNEVLDSKIPVLALFTAKWCSACKIMLPILEKFNENHKNAIKCVVIDIDSFSESSKYVRSLPTVAIFVDGSNAKTRAGTMNKNGVSSMLEEAGIVLDD